MQKLPLASLILGIVSLLLFIVVIISAPLAIAAIIVGIIALAKSRTPPSASPDGKPAESSGKGFAIAGIACGALSLVLMIVLVAAVQSFLSSYHSQAINPVEWSPEPQDDVNPVSVPDEKTVNSRTPDEADTSEPAPSEIQHELTAEEDAMIPDIPNIPDVPVSPSHPSASPDQILSIYTESAVFVPGKRSVIPEMDLLKETLDMLKEKRWDGRSSIPLKTSDYDSTFLQMLVRENDHQENYIIPQPYEDYLIGPAAHDTVLSKIKDARKEYITNLEMKGVDKRYIDELKVTIPEDQVFYFSENVDDPPLTAVSPSKKPDYSRLRLDVTAFDIYNDMENYHERNLLGPDLGEGYYGKLMDVAIRYRVYHEMTHGLQRAYVNVNAPSELKQMKEAWMNAPGLISVSSGLFREWGNEAVTLMDNRHMADESQADGISFELMVDMISMSPSQEKIIWDAQFGFLDDARDIYDYSMDIFESDFPEVLPDQFDIAYREQVLKSVDKSQEPYKTMSDLSEKWLMLPEYGGYFHPMQDTHLFWEELR